MTTPPTDERHDGRPGEPVEHEPYAGSAAPLVPPEPDLEKIRTAASGCTACHLHLHATRTVFGEGTEAAEVMLVGEQPGDKEDLAGHPFVGPAGKLLDSALESAGIDRSRVYVTNAVKHFKWKRGAGKRRLHEKPNHAEQAACRPWLEAEVAAVRPRLIVCLGATAAQAVLGKDVRVTRDRGRFFETDLAPFVMPTVHPSSILRSIDERSRAQEMRAFIADLTSVAERLRELGITPG